MKIENVPIHKITIGTRHRTDDGDIDALAKNIRAIGLLQPIGVDQYYHLIFGCRRLLACGDILRWKEIPCTVLQMDSLLAGEWAENEFRKQFTASERAAIGRAIEEELGNRKGHRTDLPAIAGKSGKGETVDLAAKRAGFGSAETFERAKTVVQHGSPELIRAMDQDEISISAGAHLASQPKAEQTRILNMPPKDRREELARIRKAQTDREASERRDRDLRVFRGLYESVQFIARFNEEPKETWAGIWRVNGFDFPDDLPRAIRFLCRLEKEAPNGQQCKITKKKTL